MRTLTSAYLINNIKNTWHIEWGTLNLLQACLPSHCERSEICHSCAIIILSKPLQVPCALLPRAKLIKKASQFLTSTPQQCLWHLKNHRKSQKLFFFLEVDLSKREQTPKSAIWHYQAASSCQSTSDMSIYLTVVAKWRSWLVWWGDACFMNLVPVLLASIEWDNKKRVKQSAKGYAIAPQCIYVKCNPWNITTSVTLCWSGHSLDLKIRLLNQKYQYPNTVEGQL